MMTAAPPAQLTAEEPELIGRAPERRLLDTLLAAPTGEVLLMWGEPGIGKSALLRYAAGTTKATVLRTRGVGSLPEPEVGAVGLRLP